MNQFRCLYRKCLTFRRDRFMRTGDAPCRQCQAGEPCQPLDIYNIADWTEAKTRIQATAVHDADIAELFYLVHKRLPMRAGISMPKRKREAVAASLAKAGVCLQLGTA